MSLNNVPLTLATVRMRRVPFAADLGEGVTLNGEFNPRCYSPAKLKEIDSLDTGDPETWAKILAGGRQKLLVSWELVWGEEDAADGLCSLEDVGKVVPIEETALQSFPVEFLVAIMNGIQGAARPNSPSSPAVSEPSSFQEAEAGSVLTNTDLLKPPDSGE